MKLYLHLADLGIVLSDLSLRLYDQDGNAVTTAGITLTALGTGTDYVLDNIPNVPSSFSGLTLTFENPLATYHAYRIGIAESQPKNVIIPIREVFASPLTDLSIKVFKNGIEHSPVSVSMLTLTGEYKVSGWDYPSILSDQWSVRWAYAGQVFSHSWVGIANLSGTRYLEINCLQPPFSIGNDTSSRAMLSFNLISTLVGNPTTTLVQLASLISGAGLAVIGASMWYGSKAQIPQTGSGPFVHLIATGGLGSLQTHNGDKRTRATVQIITRAESYTVAEGRANAIYAVLDGKHNITI